jgi:hypothetical protein
VAKLLISEEVTYLNDICSPSIRFGIMSKKSFVSLTKISMSITLYSQKICWHTIHLPGHEGNQPYAKHKYISKLALPRANVRFLHKYISPHVAYVFLFLFDDPVVEDILPLH